MPLKVNKGNGNLLYIIIIILKGDASFLKHQVIQDDTEEPNDNTDGQQIKEDHHETFAELPPRKKPSKLKKMSLLAKLKNLNELCYNIKATEEKTVDELTSLIDEAIEIAKENLNQKNECLIEREVEDCPNKRGKTFLPLPHRKPKHPASGRVGQRADMMKQWYKVKLSLEEFEKNKKVNANGKTLRNDGTKNEAKGSEKLGDEVVIESVGSEKLGDEVIIESVGRDKIKDEVIIEAVGSEKLDDEVSIVKTVKKNNKKKKPINVKFSKEISDEVLSGEWLSDMTINLAQSILLRQFPELVGLEHTSLGYTKFFSIRRGKFLQILHGQHHWVTTSSDGNGNINIYDSLSSGRIGRVFLHQIADILLTTNDIISINIQPVQQQRNGNDCGAFAIAFAVCIAFGKNPGEIAFDYFQLRKHLEHCLKENRFTPFPEVNNRVKRAKSTKVNHEVYCVCRRPYFPEDTEESSDNFMVPCSVCTEWFHKSCMKIPMEVFKSDKSAGKWKCNTCIP